MKNCALKRGLDEYRTETGGRRKDVGLDRRMRKSVTSYPPSGLIMYFECLEEVRGSREVLIRLLGGFLNWLALLFD